MNDLPAGVEVKEVGPRDGLQAEDLVQHVREMRLPEKLLRQGLPGHVMEAGIRRHLAAEAS